MENQDDSGEQAKASDSAYSLENQDNSEKHAKVSDSAYCLENQVDSEKPAKVSDSAFSLGNQDNSEKHSKVSDSAYSNSCSNSQSRKSHSSKSTRSGSNSSGSSGYGEKQTSSSSKTVPTSKTSRKRALGKPALQECKPPEPIPLNEANENKDGTETIPLPSTPERAEDSTTEPLEPNPNNDEIPDAQTPTIEDEIINSPEVDGFSCAICMNDGIVMYTTKSLTANLGFPEGMWIGRSFIEFIHPRDKNTFTSQITICLPLTKIVNSAEAQQEERIVQADQECTMACRIRRYRNTSDGFELTQRNVSYAPFFLKFTFKEIKDDSGGVVYLILKATPLLSAYKSPNEVLLNSVPFVIRHAASGALEHIDVESVPYLGYMPHDIHNKHILTMYHPDDLPELKIVYETIVKKGVLAKSMPFRMRTQNGDYVKVKTEWNSFTNPWSMKLEFIIGKHTVVEGPAIPNVFQVPPPPPNQSAESRKENKQKIEATNSLMEDIQKILNDVLTKPAETVKEHASKRVQKIATIMESILEVPKPIDDLRVDTQEGENEQDTMLGGISPHHEYKDSNSSDTTSYSYNQLNYNENLQRYFDSHRNLRYGSNSPPLLVAGDSANTLQDQQRQDQQQQDQQQQDQEYAAILTRSSPVGQKSNDISDGPSSSETCGTPATPSGGQPARLTHSVLIQHNNEMEKELAKTHREGRFIYKTNRTSENRQQNKKAHLARCNASFKPTQADGRKKTITLNSLKRTLETIESGIPAKQSCPQEAAYNHAEPQALPEPTNAIPLPVYLPAVDPVSSLVETLTSNTVTDTPQNVDYPQNNQPIIQPAYQMPLHIPATHNQPLRAPQFEPQPFSPTDNGGATPMDVSEEMPSTSFKITESKPEPEPPKPVVVKEVEKRSGLSDEELFRTDGESTYSSFYSLSLKTGSGSISSSDPAKLSQELPKKVVEPKTFVHAAPQSPLQFTRPWPKLVGMAPDLVNLYQIPEKGRVETLKDQVQKMMQLSTQPALVNDQLSQLYQDCETRGVNSRLTLEEGFTTSSSSGDDGPKTRGNPHRREYSKLNMIYEENAPLPPPSPSPHDRLSHTVSEEYSSGDPDFSTK